MNAGASSYYSAFGIGGCTCSICTGTVVSTFPNSYPSNLYGGNPYGGEPNPRFSQRPFATGSMFGLRCFRVDLNGVLTAMNPFPNPEWSTGENIAVCHRQWAVDQDLKYYGPWVPTEAEAALRIRVPEHDIAAVQCGCGFYAYFDEGRNDHHEHGAIYGVIEGYGLVTVGDRGFRCSKARIKALVLPPTAGVNWSPIMTNYPDAAIFSTNEAAVAAFPLTVPEGAVKRRPVDEFTSIVTQMSVTTQQLMAYGSSTFTIPISQWTETDQ